MEPNKNAREFGHPVERLRLPRRTAAPRSLPAMLARAGTSTEAKLIEAAVADGTRSSKRSRKAVTGRPMTAAEPKQRQRKKVRRIADARASFRGTA